MVGIVCWLVLVGFSRFVNVHPPAGSPEPDVQWVKIGDMMSPFVLGAEGKGAAVKEQFQK